MVNIFEEPDIWGATHWLIVAKNGRGIEWDVMLMRYGVVVVLAAFSCCCQEDKRRTEQIRVQPIKLGFNDHGYYEFTFETSKIFCLFLSQMNLHNIDFHGHSEQILVVPWSSLKMSVITSAFRFLEDDLEILNSNSMKPRKILRTPQLNRKEASSPFGLQYCRNKILHTFQP